MNKSTYASGDPLILFGDPDAYFVGVAKELEIAVVDKTSVTAMSGYNRDIFGVTRVALAGNNTTGAFTGILNS